MGSVGRMEWCSEVVAMRDVAKAIQDKTDLPSSPGRQAWTLHGGPTWAGTVAGEAQFLLLFSRWVSAGREG